jgi:hypothetical protein
MRRWPRIAASVAVGVAFGALPLRFRLSGRMLFFDFDQIWLAARAVLHHTDPYVTVARGFRMPLYYPLPGVLVGLPFAMGPIEWAGPLFIAIGFALLSYGLLGRGWWALLCLLNVPALQAALQCQWSPVLTAAALLPWLGWLAAAKPTTGAITAGGYFSPRWFGPNLVVGAALVAASFILWPPWLAEWVRAVRGAHHFVPLILRPGGALLMLALIRWRRPEARMLLLMALIPQTGAAYDALPLALVPSNRRESLALGFLSFATVPFLVAPEGSGDFAGAMAHNQLIFIVALYLPALLAVLARPNLRDDRDCRDDRDVPAAGAPSGG